MSKYIQNHVDSGITNSGITDWNQPSLLPVSMQIASKTIGLDLVAVKPMSSPIITGFMDFKYETPEEIARRKREEREKKFKRIFGKEDT